MIKKSDFAMQSTFPTIRSPQTKLNLPSVKNIASIMLAATITFSLTAIMQKLIVQDSIIDSGPTETFVANVFLQDDLDSPTNTKNLLPEKPKMHDQPKPIKTQRVTPDDAIPMIRVPPRYPIEASREGIEGWVQLEFTIDSSGTVKEVKVTDSEPKRVIDSEAKRALHKWKYKPQMVQGKATELPKMQVVLDFKLNS